MAFSDPKTQNGELLVNDAIQTDIIEIQFPLTIFQKDRAVRGSYLVNLPEMKRIQLEAAFDLLIDNDGCTAYAQKSDSIDNPDADILYRRCCDRYHQ